MGAVALIALIAGGPLGMCLALAYGAVSVMKIAKVDSQYAKSGGTPPSARLIEKWLDSRTAKGATPQKVKPYGSWAYAKQRWHAMWEDLGEEHAEQRDADKKARAEARAQGLPVPPRRTLKDKITALKGWKWQITTPAVERQSTATIDDLMGGPASTQPGTTDGPRTACEDCGQTLTQTGGRWAHPSSAGCPRKPAPSKEAATEMDAIQREQERRKNLTPDQAHAEARWRDEQNRKQADESKARLRELGIPEPNVQNGDGSRPPQPVRTPAPLNNPAPTGADTTNEGDTMTTTQQSGEVTGIRSAIAHAKAMADAHASHGGNEGFVGSLTTMEVGPRDIGMVQAAMEASRNAGQLWQDAADSIDQNNRAVREAYSTSPDAGNKQAQINE